MRKREVLVEPVIPEAEPLTVDLLCDAFRWVRDNRLKLESLQLRAGALGQKVNGTLASDITVFGGDLVQPQFRFPKSFSALLLAERRAAIRAEQYRQRHSDNILELRERIEDNFDNFDTWGQASSLRNSIGLCSFTPGTRPRQEEWIQNVGSSGSGEARAVDPNSGFLYLVPQDETGICYAVQPLAPSTRVWFEHKATS